MVKITFSVDEQTARTLKATAERLNKPQSLVVREAVAEYAARSSQLSEVERRRMLMAIDTMMKRPASPPPGGTARGSPAPVEPAPGRAAPNDPPRHVGDDRGPERRAGHRAGAARAG